MKKAAFISLIAGLTAVTTTAVAVPVTLTMVKDDKPQPQPVVKLTKEMAIQKIKNCFYNNYKGFFKDKEESKHVIDVDITETNLINDTPYVWVTKFNVKFTTVWSDGSKDVRPYKTFYELRNNQWFLTDYTYDILNNQTEHNKAFNNPMQWFKWDKQ